jgi:hypothetical protein
LLAVISAETLVNELPQFAENWIQAMAARKEKQEAPGWLKALAEILIEAEESKASLKSKYQLTKFILSGEPFDTGAQIFQNFALLVDLRNTIVHAKSKDAVMRKDEKSGN